MKALVYVDSWTWYDKFAANEKKLLVFSYSRISQDYFIKQKPLISDEWFFSAHWMASYLIKTWVRWWCWPIVEIKTQFFFSFSQLRDLFLRNLICKKTGFFSKKEWLEGKKSFWISNKKNVYIKSSDQVLSGFVYV